MNIVCHDLTDIPLSWNTACLLYLYSTFHVTVYMYILLRRDKPSL